MWGDRLSHKFLSALILLIGLLGLEAQAGMYSFAATHGKHVSVKHALVGAAAEEAVELCSSTGGDGDLDERRWTEDSTSAARLRSSAPAGRVAFSSLQAVADRLLLFCRPPPVQS